MDETAWHRENSGRKKGRVRKLQANAEKLDENVILRKGAKPCGKVQIEIWVQCKS